MSFLKEFGLSEEDINYIKNKYNNKIISSIIYKKENVCLLLNYFLENNFDLKSLLINRLDIFLIDFSLVKEKIESLNKTQIIEILRNDFSVFDNLG